MIRILLVDDHEIVRNILRQLLEKAGDMQVVAMASNGREAIHEAATRCPDVAVMDISMPIMDGVEATRQICVRCSGTRVLMVSSYNTPRQIRRSIEAGALGYLLKDDLSRDLVTAVRALHQGSLYFSQQIAELATFHLKRISDQTHRELVGSRRKIETAR